jgi:hypothetical protein
MQVQRRIEDVKSPKLTIVLPETFVNHKVEIIITTVDDEPMMQHAGKRRQPPLAIAGKGKIVGDIISPAAPAEDWEALQ